MCNVPTAVIMIEAIVSRALTPFHLQPWRAADQGPEDHNHHNWLSRLCGGLELMAGTNAHYLNVNLVYEVWKDVKFSFLQVSHPNPLVHIPRLLVIWGGLNLPCAMLLVVLFGVRAEPC